MARDDQPRDERGRWTTVADRAAEVNVTGVHVSPAMRPRIGDLLEHLTAGRLDVGQVAEHVRARAWSHTDEAGDSWADVERAGLDAGAFTALAAARAEADSGYVPPAPASA
jgi:hypothetical protein